MSLRLCGAFLLLSSSDSKDIHSYEGNSPALTEGYFGDLHWDIATPWLHKRLIVRR